MIDLQGFFCSFFYPNTQPLLIRIAKIDGQGLRYLPPALYIKLGDFTGGLHYYNWFNKFFRMAADIRFIFEWAITLFKTGKLKEAGEKAYQAFTRNTYLFLCRPVTPIHKWEGSNLESVDFAEKFPNYSKDEDHLADFTEWFKHYDPEFSTYGNDGV